MKLIYLSWLLGMLSYIFLGVFRRLEVSQVEISFWAPTSTTILLLMLPAGIGTVLGVMSLNRKEVKAWWSIGGIVLNIAMLLTGIFLIFPG